MSQTRISTFFSPSPTTVGALLELYMYIGCCELDEEDIDHDGEELDVCLAAVVEDKPMVGVRRSARVSATTEERRSLRVAQLLQQQTEEEAVFT